MNNEVHQCRAMLRVGTKFNLSMWLNRPVIQELTFFFYILKIIFNKARFFHSWKHSIGRGERAAVHRLWKHRQYDCIITDQRDKKSGSLLFTWGTELAQTLIFRTRMATKKYPQPFLLRKILNMCGLLNHYISIHITFYLKGPFCFLLNRIVWIT